MIIQTNHSQIIKKIICKSYSSVSTVLYNSYEKIMGPTRHNMTRLLYCTSWFIMLENIILQYSKKGLT